MPPTRCRPKLVRKLSAKCHNCNRLLSAPMKCREPYHRWLSSPNLISIYTGGRVPLGRCVEINSMKRVPLAIHKFDLHAINLRATSTAGAKKREPTTTSGNWFAWPEADGVSCPGPIPHGAGFLLDWRLIGNCQRSRRFVVSVLYI
jgi:hypothetical protein